MEMNFNNVKDFEKECLNRTFARIKHARWGYPITCNCNSYVDAFGVMWCYCLYNEMPNWVMYIYTYNGRDDSKNKNIIERTLVTPNFKFDEGYIPRH